MIKHETITKILEHGLSKGADFTEVFVEDSKSSSFNLLDRKIDQIQSSNSFGIGIRLLFGDEAYYGYSSDPDEANLIKLTGNLAESGKSGPSTDLETLEKQFPFGKYAEQAQSELIFAYYKSSSFEAAISAADRFISLHPRHPNTPYAFYLKGLAKFTDDQTFFGDLPFLGDMTYKRDLSKAKESFDDLSEFLTRYPESEYAGNARQRMIFLRNLIAKQEIYIAEYYIERKAYVAAINRANYIIQHMSKTPEVLKALEISIIAYNELGKEDLAQEAEEVLKAYKEKI